MVQEIIERCGILHTVRKREMDEQEREVLTEPTQDKPMRIQI